MTEPEENPIGMELEMNINIQEESLNLKELFNFPMECQDLDQDEELLQLRLFNDDQDIIFSLTPSLSSSTLSSNSSSSDDQVQQQLQHGSTSISIDIDDNVDVVWDASVSETTDLLNGFDPEGDLREEPGGVDFGGDLDDQPATYDHIHMQKALAQGDGEEGNGNVVPEAQRTFQLLSGTLSLPFELDIPTSEELRPQTISTLAYPNVDNPQPDKTIKYEVDRTHQKETRMIILPLNMEGLTSTPKKFPVGAAIPQDILQVSPLLSGSGDLTTTTTTSTVNDGLGDGDDDKCKRAAIASGRKSTRSRKRKKKEDFAYLSQDDSKKTKNAQTAKRTRDRQARERMEMVQEIESLQKQLLQKDESHARERAEMIQEINSLRKQLLQKNNIISEFQLLQTPSKHNDNPIPIPIPTSTSITATATDQLELDLDLNLDLALDVEPTNSPLALPFEFLPMEEENGLHFQ